MNRGVVLLGSSIGLALGTLALLLAALSIYLSRWDALLFYAVATLALFALVSWLLRRDRRARRERGELPPARAPRQPIRLPLRDTALAFLAWWALAALLIAFVDGGVFFFDYAVVAPFAAFMLTVFTFAGRHIAFRLTAEEAEERRPN